MSHAKGTTSLTAVKRLLHVILEDTTGAIVGEPLAKLDNGDQEGGFRKRFPNVAQSPLLVFSRAHAPEAIVVL
jgi:hypothetical protein